MRYVENPALAFSPEDFGARVVNETLEVPSGFFQVLEERQCRGNAEYALSCMASFPTNVGSRLSLSPEGVKRAMGGLLAQLDGHMDADYLSEIRGWLDGSLNPPKRAFGALPPADARHKPKLDTD